MNQAQDERHYQTSLRMNYAGASLVALSVAVSNTPAYFDTLHGIAYEPLGLGDDARLEEQLEQYELAMQPFRQRFRQIEEDRSVTAAEFAGLDARLQQLEEDTSLPSGLRTGSEHAREELHRADYLAPDTVLPQEYTAAHRAELAQDAVAIVQQADFRVRESLRSRYQADDGQDFVVSAIPLFLTAGAIGCVLARYHEQLVDGARTVWSTVQQGMSR